MRKLITDHPEAEEEKISLFRISQLIEMLDLVNHRTVGAPTCGLDLHGPIVPLKIMTSAGGCRPGIDDLCPAAFPAMEEPQLTEEAQSILRRQTISFNIPEPMPAGESTDDGSYSVRRCSGPGVRTNIGCHGRESCSEIVGETHKIEIVSGVRALNLVTSNGDTQTTSRC